MTKQEKLIDFFRGEFRSEEESGFGLLSRIPSSAIEQRLAHYLSLPEEEKNAYVDCSAHWAYSRYRHLIDAPEIDVRRHPYFEQWSFVRRRYTDRSVPVLRAIVQDYKNALKRGVNPPVSEDLFNIASEVKSIKAPELRKRVRKELVSLGYHKTEKPDFFHCSLDGKEFIVSLDFGSRLAQLSYSVQRPEYKRHYSNPHVRSFVDFKFEWAHGFVEDGWDFIIKENLNDTLTTLLEVVRYSYSLPDRIFKEVA